MPWAKNVYWMYSILIKDKFPINRDEVIAKLEREGLKQDHSSILFTHSHLYNKGESFPVSEELSRKGINLPSSANLRKKAVETIVKHIQALSYEA